MSTLRVVRLLQLTPAVPRHPVRVAPLRAAAPVRHLLAADVPPSRQRRRRAVRRGRGVSKLVAGVALVHGDLAQGVVQVVPRAPVAVQAGQQRTRGRWQLTSRCPCWGRQAGPRHSRESIPPPPSCCCEHRSI